MLARSCRLDIDFDEDISGRRPCLCSKDQTLKVRSLSSWTITYQILFQNKVLFLIRPAFDEQLK